MLRLSWAAIIVAVIGLILVYAGWNEMFGVEGNARAVIGGYILLFTVAFSSGFCYLTYLDAQDAQAEKLQ
jgi:hypothetical protein